MTTEYVDIHGKFKWVRAEKPDPKYGKYSVTIYPTESSRDTIKKLLQEKGLRNRMKKDDDGWYIVFSRKPTQQMGTRVIPLGPIEVYNGNMKLPDGTYAPLKGTYVGNGSDGTLRLEVYSYKPPGETKNHWAARAVSMRIDNLIPYKSKKDMELENPEELPKIENMAERPEEEWW